MLNTDTVSLSSGRFLVFTGNEGFYDATLVNPYSGYTVHISGIINVNNGIYQGSTSRGDTLGMSMQSDLLTLVNEYGEVVIKDIEDISASLGDDIIILAHSTVTYGDIWVYGNLGDDIIWTNAGNDYIFADLGDDIIDGGPGNDVIFAGKGNDYLSGGAGIDYLYGDDGDDIFAYSIDSIWSGGYTLAALGSVVPFAAQVNLDGKNQSYDTFHGDANEYLLTGNAGIDTLFMTDGDDVLVASDTLSAPLGFLSPRVSHIDIVEAGDGDDVVDFSGVDYVDVTVNGGNGDDVLGGGNGHDILNGDAGNDRLFGYTGNDVLAGGEGNDTYYYNLGNGSDTIVETSGTDSIIFGAGIGFDDITLSVSGMDMLISVGGETITVKDHFLADHSGRVETLILDDNSVYDLTSHNWNVDPVAENDMFSGDEDTIITGNVLLNDTDVNGDVLSVTAATIATENGGTVILNADGSFSYEGATNFHGTEHFSYTVTDGKGGSSSASVTLNILSVNDDPVAIADAFTGNEDEIITGSLLDNDYDVDGDALSVDAQTIVTVNGGSVTIAADGTFTYLGAANFHGNDTFDYTVRDGQGGFGTASGSIAVAAVNDDPETAEDAFTGLRNNPITGNVLANDSDIDGDVLSTQEGVFATVNGGSVTIAADGSFTYMPAPGFYGNDSFEYSALDGQGGSAAGVVNLTVSLDATTAIIGSDAGETLVGTDGDDQIFGLGGDDILYGDDGILTGVTFDKQFADTIVMPGLKEGVNISNLRPSGDPARGIAEGNLAVDYDATASITFRKGYAGYDSSFGTFGIAEDGTIVSSSMEWANVKQAGIDVTHQIDLPVGASGGAFGFFIVADGNNANGGYKGLDVTGEGTLSFVYNYGKADQRAANINDSGAKISLVYDDGVKTQVLKGNVYFTTERGESAQINKDGKVHVVSGLMDENDLSLNPKAADLSSKPVSFTKDGITVAALTGTLISQGDRIGVKSSASGGNLISGDEALHVSLAQSAEKVTISLSDISGGNTGIDFKVYIEGSSAPVSYEHVVGPVSGGKVDIVLNAADFGGLITGVEVSSVCNSARGIESFYLDNVHASIPGGMDTDTLRIGFEDLYNMGDADYEDVLFDLNINPVHVGDIGGGNDLLDGGAGDDILYGEGGDDILVIGDGYDQAYGGAGADIFAITMVDASVDKIHDFNAAEGDVINIADVLESYDPLSNDIADFVRLVQNGSDTELQISAQGDGTFVAAALIVGGADDALATLIANGALVADQSALACP